MQNSKEEADQAIDKTLAEFSQRQRLLEAKRQAKYAKPKEKFSFQDALQKFATNQRKRKSESLSTVEPGAYFIFLRNSFT